MLVLVVLTGVLRIPSNTTQNRSLAFQFGYSIYSRDIVILKGWTSKGEVGDFFFALDISWTFRICSCGWTSMLFSTALRSCDTRSNAISTIWKKGQSRSSTVFQKVSAPEWKRWRRWWRWERDELICSHPNQKKEEVLLTRGIAGREQWLIGFWQEQIVIQWTHGCHNHSPKPL